MNKTLAFLSLAAVVSVGCSSAPHNPTPKNETAGWSEPTAYREPAAECMEGGNWEECKNGRKNDWADQYMLDRSGNLFAYKKMDNGRGLKCQVTNDVKDFKISQHKNDAAAIYFERKGDLYMLTFKGDRNSKNCPAQDKKILMSNVDKYTVVSNPEGAIVNAAMDQAGNFLAWDETKVVYQDRGLKEYLMNSCFGSEGKSFSSYALFTIDRGGEVTKVKVQDRTNYNASKNAQRRYNSLQEFKDVENVCK